MTKSKVEVTSNFLKSPSQNNFSKEKIQRKKRNKTPMITGLVLLLGFLGLIAATFLLGLLNVSNYKVTGNTQVATKDIEDFVQKSAGGKLILTVNPVSIEKELLDKFSLLSFARVTKELPSTLSIEVKERAKSAVIKTLENTVLVSQDGTVIDEINDNQIVNNMYQDITVVKMIDEPKREKGYQFDSTYIKNLTTMISSWKDYKSSTHPEYKAPEFADIIVDKDKNIKFILTNGGTAVLSLSDPKQNVVESVSDLLSSYNLLSKDKKIKVIDARFDQRLNVIYF